MLRYEAYTANGSAQNLIEVTDLKADQKIEVKQFEPRDVKKHNIMSKGIAAR